MSTPFTFRNRRDVHYFLLGTDGSILKKCKQKKQNTIDGFSLKNLGAMNWKGNPLIGVIFLNFCSTFGFYRAMKRKKDT